MLRETPLPVQSQPAFGAVVFPSVKSCTVKVYPLNVFCVSFLTNNHRLSKTKQQQQQKTVPLSSRMSCIMTDSFCTRWNSVLPPQGAVTLDLRLPEHLWAGAPTPLSICGLGHQLGLSCLLTTQNSTSVSFFFTYTFLNKSGCWTSYYPFCKYQNSLKWT